MKATVKKSQTKTKPDRSEHFRTLIVWGTMPLVLLFILFMTVLRHPEYLYKIHELDIFIFNESFFRENLDRVGGLSNYLGSFLTQFFYYPWLGASLFAILLLLVGWLTSKLFHLNGWHQPLSYIPSLLLLLCLTQMGYMLYFNKIDGYVFNNILGILYVLVGWKLFSSVQKTVARLVLSLAYLLIGYPLCGAFALLGGFLMVQGALKQYGQTKQRSNLLESAILLLGMVVIPIFYYWFVYEQIALEDVYLANLPYYNFKGDERMLWLPFIGLVVTFSMFVWHKPKTDWKKPWIKIVPTFVFLTILVMTYLLSFKDVNFFTEIAMTNDIDRQEWNDVLRLARRQKEEPSRLIVMSTNLALYKMGLAGDEMYQFKNGDRPMNSPRPIVPIHVAGTSFFYQYGLPNYCSKWCMEGEVEYGFNTTDLKYFVLSSLLNGEIALAKKYNDVLKSTLFYNHWAKEQEKFINHPETIKSAMEFRDIIPLTSFEDVLNGDYYNLEAFLRDHFTYMTTVPSQLTELSILFNLEIKDDKRFWPRLFRWIKLNPTKKIPVHYQEAALLFANVTKMDISGAPFDPSVMAEFRTFLGMVQQYGNYPEQAMKDLFQAPFGKTYWYYYFFMKNKPNEN